MSISQRIIETEFGSGRLFLLKTAVDSVVSFYGSVLTGPNIERKEDLAQDVLVALLDKGSTSRDKFAISEDLESKGADINFHSKATRIGFSGRCLKQDVDSVLATCAEQLRTPDLQEDEFVKVLPRLKASVMQSMESTGSQADSALRRMLFSSDHPNSSIGPVEELLWLDSSTVEQARSFYQSRVAANDFVLVVVGDIDEVQVEKAVSSAFGDWATGGETPEYNYAAPDVTVSDIFVPMDDKMNIDLRMGHVVDLKRTDSDYLPLYLGNYVLGGNFSARLMDTIRDQEGLTYGIYSALRGFSGLYRGYFKVQASFSVQDFEQGQKRTRELIEEFASKGVTKDELASKKRTVAGSYKVGLASTSSLATTIASNIETGLGKDYIDRFPELIESTELDAVNDAIQKYIKVEELKSASAGSSLETVTN